MSLSTGFVWLKIGPMAGSFGLAVNLRVPKEAGVVSGLQTGHYSSLPAPNLQHTANHERNDQCDNQHYSRELLMMGIVVPETC